MDAESEQTPLLQPAHDIPPNSPATADLSKNRKSPAIIIFILLLYLVLLDLGPELIMPAFTSELEKIYCREYYVEHDPSLIGSDGDDGVDEKWCKVSLVQTKVAVLKGWQLALDSFGMLIFSVPWAGFADRRGRKPVLLLLTAFLVIKYAYIQFVCFLKGAVPLKLTWLSALHTAGGGSVTVATALIYTIVSDVVPRRKRITTFFQVQAANIATQFLGSLACAALLAFGNWTPMLLGLFIEFLSIMSLYFLPETLNFDRTITTQQSSPNASLEDVSYNQTRWRKLSVSIQNWVSLLTSDRRILFLVSVFVTHMLFLNRDVLLQYISTRYEISLARATLLISIRSGLILILCIFILPTLNFYARQHLGAMRSALLISRLSAGIIGLGFLGLALAPTQALAITSLIVNSLGWGLFASIRSLAVSFVDGSSVARLNSFIGIFDTLGLMVGSPLLAILFSKGLEVKGMLFGLPFLFCSGVVAIIVLGLLWITV